MITKPSSAEQAERQREQMAPRKLKEGIATLTHKDSFQWVGDAPDIRLGDLIRVTLVAAAVEDITAGFYCECQ